MFSLWNRQGSRRAPTALRPKRGQNGAGGTWVTAREAGRGGGGREAGGGGGGPTLVLGAGGQLEGMGGLRHP